MLGFCFSFILTVDSQFAWIDTISVQTDLITIELFCVVTEPFPFLRVFYLASWSGVTIIFKL